MSGAGVPADPGLDQLIALAEEMVTRMVAEIRSTLDAGESPENAILRVALTMETVDLGRVATACAVALVRLARQGRTP